MNAKQGITSYLECPLIHTLASLNILGNKRFAHDIQGLTLYVRHVDSKKSILFLKYSDTKTDIIKTFGKVPI